MNGDPMTRLLDVLRVEERVHLDLRRLLAEERERMLELDAEGLYELATRKEILAEEGRLARDARESATARLAESLGRAPTGSTLTELANAIGERAEPLREARSRLLAIVHAVAELAEANRLLGGDRLTDVQSTLHLLGRFAPDTARESARRGGHLVRRSA